jgi:hypothetical protein
MVSNCANNTGRSSARSVSMVSSSLMLLLLAVLLYTAVYPLFEKLSRK